MNLFIDTNVVMDMVAFRTPFAESAIRIFQMKDQGHRLLVSDLTYANIVYSARKIMERDRLYDLLINLRQYLSIVGVGDLNLDMDDKNDMLAGYSITCSPQLSADYRDIFFNKPIIRLWKSPIWQSMKNSVSKA